MQFKSGDLWLLYQKYAEKGYTSTRIHSYPGTDGETHTKVHTYWTQKGRLFLFEQFPCRDGGLGGEIRGDGGRAGFSDFELHGADLLC